MVFHSKIIKNGRSKTPYSDGEPLSKGDGFGVRVTWKKRAQGARSPLIRTRRADDPS